MSKHTPGPWYTAGTFRKVYVVAKEGEREVIVANSEYACTSSNLDEAEANARLIAAAPDLLEVLEWVTRLLGIHVDESHPADMLEERKAIKEVEALMAKVKGEKETSEGMQQ
jgi:hypothetical protein